MVITKPFIPEQAVHACIHNTFVVMTGMFVYADVPVIETDVSIPSSGRTILIKGIMKGKCYIYAYAQNGVVMAKAKVVVN